MDDSDPQTPLHDENDIASNDEDEEPAELDEDDMDPINSGAATPALSAAGEKVGKRLHWKQQFQKRKETKTIKGQVYTIVDDELILEDDPRGEAKIDADGNLLGGRQYKIATFTSPLRRNPNKAYMLSIDAARASGFRDSLYFFRRNPLIHKLSCTQSEKDTLIELGKLSSNLKSRAVTMVSARNCFKVMGASFVQSGKYVIDDYYEDKALAAGHKPGEPAWIETYDPEKDSGTLAAAKGPGPAGSTGTGIHGPGGKGRPTDLRGANSSGPSRDDYITSQIGGGLNATFGGNGLQPFGKTWDPAAKKAKPASHLSVENWMFEYGKSVWEHNKDLGDVRRMNVGQVQVGLDVTEREEDAWVEVEEEVDVEAEEEGPEASTSGNVVDAFEIPTAEGDKVDPSLAPPTKKRKLIKVYNPIRGIYEPETNVPHVFKSTQATTAEIALVDSLPQLEVQGDQSKRRKVEEKAKKLGIATIEYCVDEKTWDKVEDLIPGMWNFRSGIDLVGAEDEEVMALPERP